MKTNMHGDPPHFTKTKKRSAKYIAPCSLMRSKVRKPQPFSSLTAPVNPTSGVQLTTLQKSIGNMLEAEYVFPQARNSPPPRCVENVTNEVPPLRDNHQNVRDGVPHVAESGEHDNNVSVSETVVAKKVRGPNICKTVAELQPGEKLPLAFHWNRAVGVNHKAFSRYLGKIVRNNQVCPVRIKEWSDLTYAQKDHMWAATKDKFDHPEMDFYKKHVFLHMRSLWTSWRSTLHTKYIRSVNRSLEEALKVVPPIMNKEDWEWCVNEVFLTDEYQKKSIANTSNRSGKEYHAHNGTRPARQISYELGIANGGKANQADVFFRTYATKDEIMNEVAKEKHDKMKKIIEDNPTWTELEVAEATFGPQKKGHVTGFGGGIRPKDLKGTSSTSKAELATRLRQSETQNTVLQDSVTTLHTTISEQASMMVTIMEELRVLKEKVSPNEH